MIRYENDAWFKIFDGAWLVEPDELEKLIPCSVFISKHTVKIS